MGIDIRIQKTYKNFKFDINMHNDAKMLGVLGPSGAGKSMLLKCIAGLVKPDDGKVVIGNRVLYDSEKNIDLPPQERRVGFLFQNYCLMPHLNVFDNIAFGPSVSGQKYDRQRIDMLMEKFQLTSLAQRRPSEISGGQQQRVALARALAVEPDILLLDEPFSALDNHLKVHMIQQMLEDLSNYQGMVIMVSHNIDEAYRLCDTIAVIHSGKMIDCGEKRMLIDHPKTASSARITGCKNIAPAMRINNTQIAVPNWGIELKTASSFMYTHGIAAVRANFIRMAAGTERENIFSICIRRTIETPFRVTLIFSFSDAHENGQNEQNGLLHWEIGRDLWETVQGQASLKIHIPPESALYLISDED
ncbi:sulfate/molybdate ABC transporter ATP-binding protein [Fusibacter paucivorans]|uniref:Sulfate/molybdate ABC transporter ATP-binding protein n=1 Tax=Fusibacter paucivorans TaxID=76009 RepID=A0ABS5PUA1_9FIRM|nr:sulfate/molybdate ABC transporter ATP-binding protein [Fusibacter paucivorans]MBS7528442.1 sulfate/molybdate ABC transporter ATP-binding protein [Fusibacter paucivorans]